MEQSVVLDLLQLYGLRQAYLILLLAARSGTHLQRLHDEGIDPTCRMPRHLLIDLKKDRERMFGSARRPNAMSDEAILAEFESAARRGGIHANLDAFYWERLTSERRGFEPSLGRNKRTVYIAAKDEHGHPQNGSYATWCGASVEALIRAERAPEEGARSILCVYIDAHGTLTDEAVRRMLAAPAWRTACRFNPGKMSFLYELPLDGLERHLAPAVRMMDAPNETGFDLRTELPETSLEALRAHVTLATGLTDFRPDWQASPKF